MDKLFKSSEIVIELTKEDYDLLGIIISKYQNKFSFEIESLVNLEKKLMSKYSFESELKLINNFNKIVKIMLEEIANEFPAFAKNKVLIFLTGSYSRFSNRSNSDVDIHFCYDNSLRDDMIKYEEMYFYIVSVLIKLPRNNLHSVITTKLSKENTEWFKNNNYGDLNVILRLDSKNYYSYIFKQKTRKRYFLQHYNSKDFSDIMEYLKLEIANNNSEWAHNFFPITEKEFFYQKINELKKFEYEIMTKEKIANTIRDIRNNIENIKFDVCTVDLIKKAYQQQAYWGIYNTLNVLRAYVNKNSGESFLFNFDILLKDMKFLKIHEFSESIESIFYYMWHVKKMSLYCDEVNVPYSLHHSHEVSFSFLSDIDIAWVNLKNKLHQILNYVEGEL